MIRFWKFFGTLFLEGMLKRTAEGEKLGFRSKRAWGSNLMFGGILGFLICIIWFGQRLHFELDARTTTAEVLEVQRDRTSNGKTVFQLTLEWTDDQGVTHVTVPRVKSSAYNVPVGTSLDIAYDPNNPKDVRVMRREGPWYMPTLFTIGSAISLFMGWLTRRRAKS